MEDLSSEDLCVIEPNADDPASTSSSCKLPGRQATVHRMVGGGKAADVILWRRRRVSCGIIIVATVSWLLVERSGISFLALCSDILLVLVVLLFIAANYAVFRNKQPPTLPELVLSEEMVNNAAASLRVKVNYMLLMAHDITLGKDFRLFFKVACNGDGNNSGFMLATEGSFLIDVDFHIREIHLRFPTRGADTLLYGQLIIETSSNSGKQQRRFYLSHVLIIDGYPVRNLRFNERWNIIESQLLGPRDTERARNYHLYKTLLR
ncbi:reticulon family protein [Striga asiatica]|uniref:Reticulon-like protein n=1 Tax=Striga asiatica TaxID=4170 RepID=A0A5A7QKY3_STRAF|nr:reticulon family protein [Striga asiatica]